MNKNFKLALVPLALAGALASNSALAGSEACLEIYTGDSSNVGQYTDSNGVVQTGFTGVNFNGVRSFDAEYSASGCNSLRSGASAVDLEGFQPLTVAQELTRAADIDLFDLEGTALATVSSTIASPSNFSKNVVYVPTSPLPGGTRISFRLHNANWVDSQLHLIALNDEQLDGSEPTILAVAATTDGQPFEDVAGTEDFDFIVPSGLTIPAGTRLAMSTSTQNISPPSIQFENDQCLVNPQIDISVPAALNSIGGTRIEGGETSGTDKLIVTKRQFALFNNHNTATGVVDALAPSLRTLFTTDVVAGALDGASTTRVYLQSNFSDSLDITGGVELGVELGTLDHVEITPTGVPSVAANVDLQLFDTLFENGASADTFADNLVFNNDVLGGSRTFIDIDSAADASPTTYSLDALDVFAQGQDFVATSGDNPTFFALTQTNTANVIEPSRFFVDFDYTLDFDNIALLDHCAGDLRAYEINTNGSVLKVPYHFEAGGNWIRVTNEFNQEAVISMDIQGEVGTDVEAASYKVGVVLSQSVPPNGSVLLQVSDLVAQAEAAGYVSGGDVTSGQNQRHTITLVVSAPSDLVHGVAVQKVDGNDRVVPVLDLNSWQQ
jgi:hypothetical protein